MKIYYVLLMALTVIFMVLIFVGLITSNQCHMELTAAEIGLLIAFSLQLDEWRKD